MAQDGVIEAVGLDEDGALEETDLDVVVTLEGVEDLDAVDLDEFAVDVDVDVDLEVDVDIENGDGDIDVADLDASLAEIEAEDTEDEAAAAGPDEPAARVKVPRRSRPLARRPPGRHRQDRPGPARKATTRPSSTATMTTTCPPPRWRRPGPPRTRSRTT